MDSTPEQPSIASAPSSGAADSGAQQSQQPPSAAADKLSKKRMAARIRQQRCRARKRKLAMEMRMKRDAMLNGRNGGHNSVLSGFAWNGPPPAPTPPPPPLPPPTLPGSATAAGRCGSPQKMSRTEGDMVLGNMASAQPQQPQQQQQMVIHSHDPSHQASAPHGLRPPAPFVTPTRPASTVQPQPTFASPFSLSTNNHDPNCAPDERRVYASPSFEIMNNNNHENQLFPMVTQHQHPQYQQQQQHQLHQQHQQQHLQPQMHEVTPTPSTHHQHTTVPAVGDGDQTMHGNNARNNTSHNHLAHIRHRRSNSEMAKREAVDAILSLKRHGNNGNGNGGSNTNNNRSSSRKVGVGGFFGHGSSSRIAPNVVSGGRRTPSPHPPHLYQQQHYKHEQNNISAAVVQGVSSTGSEDWSTASSSAGYFQGGPPPPVRQAAGGGLPPPPPPPPPPPNAPGFYLYMRQGHPHPMSPTSSGDSTPSPPRPGSASGSPTHV